MAFENFGQAMKIMGAWNKFKANHPKFPAFLKAVQKKGIKPDTILEVIITTPEGERIETSIKVCQGDLDALHELKSLNPNQ